MSDPLTVTELGNFWGLLKAGAWRKIIRICKGNEHLAEEAMISFVHSHSYDAADVERFPEASMTDVAFGMDMVDLRRQVGIMAAKYPTDFVAFILVLEQAVEDVFSVLGGRKTPLPDD